MWILSGLAGLALLIAVVYLVAAMSIRGRPLIPGVPRQYRTIAWIVVILSVVVFSCQIVPSNCRGVLYNMGKAVKVCQPGPNFIIPFMQRVDLVTIRPTQIDLKIEVGADGAITKDNQTVGAMLTIFYKYKPADLLIMVNEYGEDKMKSIILQSTKKSFKSEIGQHTIFDIPLNQSTLSAKAVQAIRSEIAAYPVEITEIMVTNYDWSDEFDKQIQETMHRAQQVKQKEQELLITEQEAQKKVKLAEADKTALITTAEGEKAAALLRADAKAAEGEGIKKYNQAVQANMTLEIQLRELEIKKIQAERWNGAYVPTNHYGPIPVQTGSMQPQQ